MHGGQPPYPMDQRSHHSIERSCSRRNAKEEAGYGNPYVRTKAGKEGYHCLDGWEFDELPCAVKMKPKAPIIAPLMRLECW